MRHKQNVWKQNKKLFTKMPDIIPYSVKKKQQNIIAAINIQLLYKTKIKHLISSFE